MTVQCIAVFLLRLPLSKLFVSNRAVVDEILITLPYVIVFNFFDGLQATMTGAITATGKQVGQK
jgi:Na+-driven multidrug efflux pump